VKPVSSVPQARRSLGEVGSVLALFALLLISHPPSAISSDIAPTLRWYVDTEKLAKQDLLIRRGETVDLQPTYRNYGDPIDLTPAHLVIFRYRPTTSTNLSSYYVITGQVAVATGGVVNVRWNTANEATNSSYVYEIAVQSTDAMLVRSYGNLLLQQGIANVGATSTVPAAVLSIDWATVDHSNIGAAPFLSTFSIADLEAFDATLTNGAAQLHVHSITSDVPYYGSATNLYDFPSYLARVGDLTPNSVTSVVKGVDEAVGRLERVDEHTVSVHFPIVGEGEIQTTNRLYWVVDGVAVGYVSTNGITMLHGSLQLYEDDLNCNVRAYDGAAAAPSMTFYSAPLDGWYRKSIAGGSGWAYAHNSNTVAVIYDDGWLLYGSRKFTGYGAELSYCNVTAAYQVNGTNGLTTNINVIVAGGATQTLHFVGGLLLP
jgi:hypothetical protein